MSRIPPAASPPPLPPEADKARIIARYDGAQIEDARDHIRIVLTREPPRCVKGCLRRDGFLPNGPNGAWQRKHSPIAAITAAAICNTFFDKEIP